MLGNQDLHQLAGATAYDRDGEKLGTVDAVYVDNETGEATFALVRTGLFGSRSSFVPLTDARVEGGDLHVAHPAVRVKEAPSLDVDEELEPAQELALYRYYGIPAVPGDTPDRPAQTSDELPTGADLVADQGFDPMLDGPRVSTEERLRLRRLGDPASSADDALLEHGEEQQ